MKRLLKNGRILTMSNGKPVCLEKGFLGIDGDTICYLGTEPPQDEKSYDETRDFSGRLLIPGLIDCHCHAAMTLLRGVGTDLPLQSWLFDNIFPLEDKLNEIPDGIRIGSELAIMEMLAGGITSFTDMYMQPEGTAEEILACGIKANICNYVQSFDPAEEYKDNLKAKRSFALYDRYHGAGDGRLLVDFAMHAEYTNTEKSMRGYTDECLSRGGRMHLHLSETKSEHEECKMRHGGMTPAEYFCSIGTFDLPTAAAHCVWVEPHDLDIFREKGVFPIHNPTSNMKLGSGFAPIPKMLEMGIPVTLGTDGAASNNNLNMFEEMHLASIIHKGYAHDAALMRAEDVFLMATRNGAMQQGRPDTGTLEVGKKADVVAIDLTGLHMLPAFDACSALCYQTQASDVCMTMVDGRILYENGEFLTMDKERILSDYDRILKALFA